MSTNYLAVISCDHCGEMIRTMPNGSIICACTTKRFCKHPEGMGNCHDCFIDDLERQLKTIQEAGQALADHVHYDYDANCVVADRMLAVIKDQNK